MKKLIGTLINTYSIMDMQGAIKMAYGLFATPRKGQIKKQIPEFLKQASLSTLQFKDLQIQCYSWNPDKKSKGAILLVHGWQSNSNRWSALFESLPKDYQVVAVDAMAQGKSQGKELSVFEYTQLLNQVLSKVDPSIIVAHSLGGFALLHSLSFKVNPKLQKVVLLGALDKFEHIVTNYFTMMGYNKALQRNFVSYIESVIQRDLSSYASFEFVKQLQVEFLVIHDKSDVIVEVEKCVNLHQELLLKNAQIIYSDYSDHSLQDPRVYSHITEFITLK